MCAQPLFRQHPILHSGSYIATRDMKRAIDYIEANIDRPITLPDIVGAAGVPGRTLFAHFNRSGAPSPMHYLRRARLIRVCEALQRANPSASVTEIATSWGFTHMGRFAAEYRKHFGEAPSATLRKQA